MKALVLTLLLLQAAPERAGFVTGVVRSATGTPAVGVRVYAVAVPDAVDPANSPAVFESLTETDVSGRYRLEVPPGRHYIASGSVSSPTYYPGTTDIASARILTVTAAGLVENIDFSSFVPASRNPLGFPALPPGSTGVLSGVIRYPDGTPATGTAVVAIPVSAVNAAGGTASAAIPNRAVALLTYGLYRMPASDVNGRYRIENLSPDTYYVAAGLAEAPDFYPGTGDVLSAKSVTTTPTTKIDTLDFVVQRPRPPTTVSGRVVGLGEHPASGAYVEMRSPSTAVAGQYGLPPGTSALPITVGEDGTFEFRDVSPGDYVVQVQVPGVRNALQSVTVSSDPVRDLEFRLPTVVFSGKVVGEDGNVIPDPQSFKDVIVTTVTNPFLISSTILPISGSGAFSRVLEADEYRVYVRSLPEHYVIRSVTAAGTDLLKNRLKIDGSESVAVQISVARREENSAAAAEPSAGVRVRGTVLDALSGLRPAAERVTLCCLDSGPTQGSSAPLQPDGSFEFHEVPPQRYTVGLQVPSGQPDILIVERELEVGSQALDRTTLTSTPSFATIAATIAVEGGGRSRSPARVAFRAVTGAQGVFEGIMGPDGATVVASVPAHGEYKVLVDLPAGYRVKSINGLTDISEVTVRADAAPPAETTVTIVVATFPVL